MSEGHAHGCAKPDSGWRCLSGTLGHYPAAGMPKVIRITRLFGGLVIALGSVASTPWSAAGQSALDDKLAAQSRPTLLDAQRLFFNAQYDDAAVSTLALRSADPEDLATCELRTSTLLLSLIHI